MDVADSKVNIYKDTEAYDYAITFNDYLMMMKSDA